MNIGQPSHFAGTDRSVDVARKHNDTYAAIWRLLGDIHRRLVILEGNIGDKDRKANAEVAAAITNITSVHAALSGLSPPFLHYASSPSQLTPTGFFWDSVNSLMIGPRLQLTQAAGTSPLVVSSGTKVSNLNADYLDGFHYEDLEVSQVSLTFADHDLSTKTYNGFIVLVECDATGGAFTVDLPALASAEERLYIFKKIDATANAVTVQAVTGETIR